MTKSQIFPAILILINIGAAVVYLAADRDWRQFVYWMAAATLTTCVTIK